MTAARIAYKGLIGFFWHMINELQLESRSDRYQEVHFYFYPETEKDIDHIKDSFSKMFAGKDTFKYYLMDNRRLSRIYYES